jgi:hypothetical protein
VAISMKLALGTVLWSFLLLLLVVVVKKTE